MTPVGRSGCGGLLVSRWYHRLCAVTMTMVHVSVCHCRLHLHVFAACPENAWRISSFFVCFFLTFFFGTLFRHQEVTGESGGNFEDYIRFLSCHLFGPVNHGQTWKGWERSGEKAWLSVIIKLKLPWLSRSMILPLGTSPWLSISVIHSKIRLKGLILIILSTYQAWLWSLWWGYWRLLI
jgi:hypothetical protein